MKNIILTLLFSSLTFSFSAFGMQVNCPENVDSLGIVHVTAQSREDFYRCFGYIHGRDRAWQMDYFRRVTQGRNAEVLGFSQLKTDLMMRLLDLPAHAQKLWDQMPLDDKQWWQAYAQGVNIGFSVGKNAVEFRDAGYEPEEWKVEHSVALLLLQSFDQTRRTFFRDYEEQLGADKYGVEAESLFNLDGVPWHDTILKEGEYPKTEQTEVKTTGVQQRAHKLWGKFPAVFGEESGSNSWVVAKGKSKSGKALFANDPHLDLKTPLFWYWLHFKWDSGQVIGATLPGVPVVASGTNGKVAWGLTNAYINTADAFYLKNIPSGGLVSVRPLVWIKFGFLKLPFFFKSFERTKEGNLPILPLETKSDDPIVMRWSGFWLRPQDVSGMLHFMNSQNVSDMHKELGTVELPAWNFVYADTNGDIGYRVIGKVFKHTHKPAFGIAPIDYEQIHRPEFLAQDERPHVLKPQRNYVVTANHRQWPADSKFHGGQGYSMSFRGFRINEKIQDGSHDVLSFQATQCDHQAVDARFFVPLLLQSLEGQQGEEFDKVRTLLSGWNFETDPACEACGVYRRWMDLINHEFKTQEPGTYRLLQNLSETNKKVVLDMLKIALRDTQGKTWKELHLNPFKHISGNEKWKFSPEIHTAGDSHSVDPGSAKWDEDRKIFEHYSGASERLIIEMGTKPTIWLNLPGKNFNYAEKSEANPWQEWADCVYREVEW